MSPGTLIIIGSFTIVLGLMPPFHLMSLVAGSICLGIGIYSLIEESKNE